MNKYIKGLTMLRNKFGTLVPQTEEEFWMLYITFQITYVPMLTRQNSKCEVPSYEVVEYLMKGWSFDTSTKRY
jgi:hypothetical protein